MIIRASGNQSQSLFLQFTCKRLGVLQNLSLVFLEFIAKRFAKSNGFRCNDVHQWTTLHTRKELSVYFFRMFFLTENQSASRPAKRFVRCRCDVVGMRNGRRMEIRSDRSGDV